MSIHDEVTKEELYPIELDNIDSPNGRFCVNCGYKRENGEWGENYVRLDGRLYCLRCRPERCDSCHNWLLFDEKNDEYYCPMCE